MLNVLLQKFMALQDFLEGQKIMGLLALIISAADMGVSLIGSVRQKAFKRNEYRHKIARAIAGQLECFTSEINDWLIYIQHVTTEEEIKNYLKKFDSIQKRIDTAQFKAKFLNDVKLDNELMEVQLLITPLPKALAIDFHIWSEKESHYYTGISISKKTIEQQTASQETLNESKEKIMAHTEEVRKLLNKFYMGK